MAAARRIGFRRRLNTHPVEALEDPDVAIVGTGIAFLELGGLPTAEQHTALTIRLQHHLGQSHNKAEEALILGRWLVTECGGAQAGLTRLTRRVFKLKRTSSFEPLLAVVKDVAATGHGSVSQRQREALSEIAALYRIT